MNKNNNRGVICFNKDVIEKEVKFYNDLVISICSTGGEDKRHKEVKEKLIEQLPALAANTIYNTLHLDQLRKSKGDNNVDGWIDSMLLDCSIKDFYTDPNVADRERNKVRGKKITPCGTAAKKRISSGGYGSKASITHAAKYITDEKIEELKGAVEKDKAKFDRLQEIIEAKDIMVKSKGKAEPPKKKVTKKKVAKKVAKKVVKKITKRVVKNTKKKISTVKDKK